MAIRSILIANRGEIACRVIRSCKRLGIRSVAVFSEADRSALHVKLADEAMALGGFESKDSYLKIDSVVAAAKKARVDAVHPGYGFLSENPLFAEALEKARIKLIGPPAKTMRALGDKIRAKELAARCRVPTVPSLIIKPSSKDVGREVAAFGKDVGYPLLVKASAGGGGRGMRRVDSAGAIKATVASAAREAEAFFGDGRIFVEKLILNPRHIEVQILGDTHGAVTHLFDRDCTMQRRHQKVIEEAPAPHLTPRTRAELLAAATRLAEAAGYANAGTAEFLLDTGGGFYFLEVNSRLQVEHPVTEEHVGVDLVELQIKITDGAHLSEILNPVPVEERRNVAIEARVCAEDPARGFAPSTGRIELFSIPHETGIRVETGVESGSFVRHFYDPLIAKVIATGQDREDARLKLLGALKGSAIAGITTNIPYLIKLLSSTAFISCTHDTKVAECAAEERAQETDLHLKIAALWAAARTFHESDGDVWNEMKGFRIAGCSTRNDTVLVKGEEIALRVTQLDPKTIECAASTAARSAQFGIRLRLVGDRLLSLLVNKEEVTARHVAGVDRDWIALQGESFEVTQKRSGGRAVTGGRSGELISPLPGKILKVAAKKGAAVREGAVIFVLESMKMEHSIAAPRSGILRELLTAPGKVVDSGTVLGIIEPEKTSGGKKKRSKSVKRPGKK